jgi:hypothetical protein
MAAQLDAKPKRLDVLIINDDGEIPSILNPLTGQIFVTNRVGKAVIQLADGSRTGGDIVGWVQTHFSGQPPDVMAREVLAFLEEGAGRGLIAWAA